MAAAAAAAASRESSTIHSCAHGHSPRIEWPLHMMSKDRVNLMFVFVKQSRANIRVSICGVRGDFNARRQEILAAAAKQAKRASPSASLLLLLVPSLSSISLSLSSSSRKQRCQLAYSMAEKHNLEYLNFICQAKVFFWLFGMSFWDDLFYCMACKIKKIWHILLKNLPYATVSEMATLVGEKESQVR